MRILNFCAVIDKLYHELKVKYANKACALGFPTGRNTHAKTLLMSGLVDLIEFALAPQHETSCDSEITTKEDFDYWRKIIEESNLEVYRRIHNKPNEAEN